MLRLLFFCPTSGELSPSDPQQKFPKKTSLLLCSSLILCVFEVTRWLLGISFFVLKGKINLFSWIQACEFCCAPLFFQPQPFVFPSGFFVNKTVCTLSFHGNNIHQLVPSSLKIAVSSLPEQSSWRLAPWLYKDKVTSSERPSLTLHFWTFPCLNLIFTTPLNSFWICVARRYPMYCLLFESTVSPH